MVETGDQAPDFSAPMATPDHAADDSGKYTGDHVEAFSLDAALGEGPVVLAFFPGIFSRTCTTELCEVRDWLADLGELEASVYGVSVDAPFGQLAFIDAYDLNYPLLSGFNNDVIDDYGVRIDGGLLDGIAARAVFVIAPDGTIGYDWVVREPGVLPDLEAVRDAVQAA